MFFGSIPALVTPFSGGRVAEDTFTTARNVRKFTDMADSPAKPAKHEMERRVPQRFDYQDQGEGP